MPGGYLEPELESRRLAWSWAESRLEAARSYWIASVCASGHPHARPVWGVWLDSCLYFSSGSRIRANLERDSHVSVNLESGDECVILEGDARLLHDAALTTHIAAVYNAKYSWDIQASPGEFFEVRPRVVFGWLCDGSGLDGGALFSHTATRWRLE
jgi:hypothetical protein